MSKFSTFEDDLDVNNALRAQVKTLEDQLQSSRAEILACNKELAECTKLLDTYRNRYRAYSHALVVALKLLSKQDAEAVLDSIPNSNR